MNRSAHRFLAGFRGRSLWSRQISVAIGLFAPTPGIVGIGYAVPCGASASEYRVRIEKVDFGSPDRSAALHPFPNP